MDARPSTPAAVATPDLLERSCLCVCCLAPNRPIDEFCGACGMPIGQYVATDPFKSIETRYRYLGRATDGYVSGWAVLGFWLLLGPHLAMLAVLVCYVVVTGAWGMLADFTAATTDGMYTTEPTYWSRYPIADRLETLASILGFVVVLAEYAVYLVLLYRVTRRYRDQRGLAPRPE